MLCAHSCPRRSLAVRQPERCIRLRFRRMAEVLGWPRNAGSGATRRAFRRLEKPDTPAALALAADQPDPDAADGSADPVEDPEFQIDAPQVRIYRMAWIRRSPRSGDCSCRGQPRPEPRSRGATAPAADRAAAPEAHNTADAPARRPTGTPSAPQGPAAAPLRTRARTGPCARLARGTGMPTPSPRSAFRNSSRNARSRSLAGPRSSTSSQ